MGVDVTTGGFSVDDGIYIYYKCDVKGVGADEYCMSRIE